MKNIEINFDGIIGPSHNYAGLSLGNIASSKNKGAVSMPRAAALQGIEKMRSNMNLGLTQGFFMPLPRPNIGWLNHLGCDLENAPDALLAAAYSASSMWAANAATISPAADTKDGKTHLTPANLITMPHRSHEWPDMQKQLKLIFANQEYFTVHDPIKAPFGDEGAANHMRLCSRHDQSGIEIFIYGKSGGAFPARQHEQSSRAIARLHGLNPEKTLFIEQSEIAIASGAFHNDVVAVANENVLFTHEQAFQDKDAAYAMIEAKMPEAIIVEVPKDRISLADAISSYLFNAQLVTLPNGDGMALILPSESQENTPVWSWLEEMVAGNGPIQKLVPVNVRQSMANGGGPACLRLRVVCNTDMVDPRFIATNEKLDQISQIISQYWPEQISADNLRDMALLEQVKIARTQLLTACDIDDLL
ncbi:succinylarginine dihydrolase [Sphingorhabdus lutea]|uniref:N-succinylarginine dihydrolase n=1 Tax=Sphingorhabdus lutea TaxID=1913578 RepID=A0A1L3JCJ8_9SPHN|nr:N-succinylarginine dihydrolase [Sphingorhabdus lutea]APG62861.1 succinylarginine dihydrolase [Sphingorhabdus lutea]